MPSVRFGLTIPASDRPQVLALDIWATGIGDLHTADVTHKIPRSRPRGKAFRVTGSSSTGHSTEKPIGRTLKTSGRIFSFFNSEFY
jgi:hypothetical protein